MEGFVETFLDEDSREPEVAEISPISRQLFDDTGWRHRLNPAVSPVRACLLFFPTYVVAVIAGRSLIIPGSLISATWPAVGVAFAWLFPLACHRRWWTQPTLWVAAGLIWTGSVTVNLVTGLPWVIVPFAGLSNVVGALVTSLVFIARCNGLPQLTTARELRCFVGSCLIGVSAAWFTFPLSGLVSGRLSFLTTMFWMLRNVVSIVVLGAGALLFLGTSSHRMMTRGSWAIAVIAAGLSGALIVGATQFQAERAVSFAVIIIGIGTATLFSPRQVYAYVLVVALVITVMATTGHPPFGGDTAADQAGLAHSVILIVFVVAMSTSLDREERVALLHQVRREAVAARQAGNRAGLQARLLSTVVAAMHEGVVVLDEAGRAVVVNDAATRLVGLSPGDQPLDLCPALVDIVNTESEGPTDMDRPGLSGPHHSGHGTLEVAVTRIDTDDIARTVLIVRDVTVERRHVDDLRTFARVAAHDLRQPLAALVMWLEILADDLPAPPDGTSTRDMLAPLRAATERMETFLNDLTDYSVARDGVPQPSRFVVEDLVRQVITERLVRMSGPPASVDVDAPVEMSADPVMMRQVVDNVISNAMKYVQEGQAPRVDVSAAVEADDVVLRIDDAGVGIPAGEEEAVFTEFHRAQEHAAHYAGSGLGLAICRRIVERHGGTIKAGASPLGGTRIEIRMPRPEGAADSR
ncbi:ATP-binding protein [Austwickia sp. TVS 96-490-7B]|uniref:sensor histidine kinase n=1 Tax=Austwickia sp. TVS 96-490-7B TaxID=2830843 RepID=UPI001C58E235|nr:ATP-binding protein [Austwickia sp. TVS 96-490-7B]